MKKQISVAGLVMLVGGAVTFLFSFFNFWKFGSQGTSAWGDGLFPVPTIIAIMGLAMAVVAVLGLTGVKLPDQVLTFSWTQINFVWGLTAAAFMLAFLIQDRGGIDTGIGLIFMLLGSLAMLVGSAMALFGMGTHMVEMPDMPNTGGQSSGTTDTTESTD